MRHYGYERVESLGVNQFDNQNGNILKNQIIGLLQAVSYLRCKYITSITVIIHSFTLIFIQPSSFKFHNIVPLIIVNILVIVIEILAGG